MKDIDTLLADHGAAVQHFVGRAGAIGPDRWLVPRAPGKWTPAEETRHLILTYRAFTADLRGERRSALRGNALRRRIWRLIGLTWIIHLKRIPRAVRAPREVRPEGERGEQPVLLAELQREVTGFEQAFRDAWSRASARVRHPFFGDLTLPEAIQLAAVHTRHHAAFLPATKKE